MINRGGENLFPREIEDFLNTHENILETHVVSYLACTLIKNILN